MGFIDFSTGDVLTANQMDTVLRQSVMRFADASARDTAIGTALAEGMLAYLDDTNEVLKYDGSSWIDISGDISAVTAGTALTGGGTSGNVTLDVDLTAITIPQSQVTDLTTDLAGKQDDVITTEGDLVIGDASGDPARLAIGAEDTVLTSDGTTVSWQASSGGGAGINLKGLGNIVTTINAGTYIVDSTVSAKVGDDYIYPGKQTLVVGTAVGTVNAYLPSFHEATAQGMVGNGNLANTYSRFDLDPFFKEIEWGGRPAWVTTVGGNDSSTSGTAYIYKSHDEGQTWHTSSYWESANFAQSGAKTFSDDGLEVFSFTGEYAYKGDTKVNNSGVPISGFSGVQFEWVSSYGGTYVVALSTGQIYTSTDWSTWTLRYTMPDDVGIADLGSYYLLHSDDSTPDSGGNFLVYTTDFTTYTVPNPFGTFTGSEGLRGIDHFGSTAIVGIYTKNEVYVTTNGTTWTDVTPSDIDVLSNVALTRPDGYLVVNATNTSAGTGWYVSYDLGTNWSFFDNGRIAGTRKAFNYGSAIYATTAASRWEWYEVNPAPGGTPYGTYTDAPYFGAYTQGAQNAGYLNGKIILQFPSLTSYGFSTGKFATSKDPKITFTLAEEIGA